MLLLNKQHIFFVLLLKIYHVTFNESRRSPCLANYYLYKKKESIVDSKTIAVDFDGTIVENAYPGIGKPMLFAFETLKKLQQEGHTLILWTYRAGIKLDEAVAYCSKNGLTFYAVNKSYPEEVMSNAVSRKINADIFIDDRDVRGMLGWGEIYQILGAANKNTTTHKKKKHTSRKTKKGFMSRLEELFKEDNN